MGLRNYDSFKDDVVRVAKISRNACHYFNDTVVKETLVDPKLAPGLAYNKQLLGIEEAINPSFSTLTFSCAQ
ncbi:hypothetical protein LguiA_027022 [Lonicera macranthoides]